MDKELYNICMGLNTRIDCFKQLTTLNKSYNYEGKISKLHLLIDGVSLDKDIISNKIK